MKVDLSLKKSGVYKILNTATGRSYVGSGKNIYVRLSYHFSRLRSNKHSNIYLQSSFNKHGEGAFSISILEECAISLLKEREQFYIDTTLKKYNLIEKTCGPLSLPSWNTNRRERVIQKLTGQKRTPEQCRRISESHKGLKLSEESKLKQSASVSEFYSTPEGRRIQSEKGKAGTIAAREKFLLDHPDGRKVKWVTKICECGCGKTFEAWPHIAKHKKFFSNECRGRAMKGKIPWNKGIKITKKETL